MKLLENKIYRVINDFKWSEYQVSDFVQNIVEKITPANSGLKKYIGLKHLDTGSLHIERFDPIDSVEGEKLRGYKGDIVFAKRNAYLKRAAILDGEAAVSAHALVLRAKPEVINRDFLAFFMLSDVFWDKAIEISVGSLSPTINWKNLASQRFLLPPIEAQEAISELLNSIDDVIVKEKALLKAAIVNKHAFRKKVFLGFDKNLLKKSSDLEENTNWHVKSISEVCVVENNLRKPINKEDREAMKGSYPYFGPTSILSYISEYRVEGEYTLLGEDGDHFLKYDNWSMSQWATGKFNVNNHAHLLRGTPDCLTKWIFYTFQHRNIIPHLTKQGATRYKLNKESLLDINLMIPPIVEQKKLIRIFDSIEDNISMISKKIDSTNKLRMSIVNRIF